MTSPLEIVLLGTGAPLPNPDRCGAGNVVVAGDTRVLVDCGWGSARRLFAAGLPPFMIDTACFTHLHSDHVTDVPDFLIMRWTGGAIRPLTVYGPQGTRDMMDSFLAALRPDIKYRFAHHGEKLSQDGIRCVVHEVPATPARRHAADVGTLRIESFEVDHYPVVPALGFRFEAGGRSLVLSGDTKPCPTLVEAARGADMLVCEAMNVAMLTAVIERLKPINANTAGLLTDAIDYHSPTGEVARMAAEAGVGALVLSHLIPSIPNEGAPAGQFVAGMSDIYKGPITLGRDLQRISIGA